MTTEEKKLTAALLHLASDTFANHGCNDFDLTPFFPDKVERDAMVFESFGETFEHSSTDGDYRLGDYALMRLMADRLDAEAAL